MECLKHGVKKEGESCTLNNNCIYPACKRLLFDPERSLMAQLADIDNEEQAKDWYKQYLNYHQGKDQGVKYLIGYFIDTKRNLLNKWLNN